MSHGLCGPHSRSHDLRQERRAHRRSRPPRRHPARRGRDPSPGGSRGSARSVARAHEAKAVSAFASIGDEIATGPVACGPRLGRLHRRSADHRQDRHAANLPPLDAADRQWSQAAMSIPEHRQPTPRSSCPTCCSCRSPPSTGAATASATAPASTTARWRGWRAKKEIVAIGIAYAAQEVLFVPNDAHDEPLDLIVTEEGTRS